MSNPADLVESNHNNEHFAAKFRGDMHKKAPDPIREGTRSAYGHVQKRFTVMKIDLLVNITEKSDDSA
jgi:hypothetical protein